MNKQTDIFIKIVLDAWNNFLNDFENLGQHGGYLPEREEDVRCYLFCEIRKELLSQGLSLIDLHAEYMPSDMGSNYERLDLVVGGYPDEIQVGVEIKFGSNILTDLNKLKCWIIEHRIKSGVFLSLNKHSLDRILDKNIIQEFSLEEKDIGTNNFFSWDRVYTEGEAFTRNYWNIDYDALKIVLRH